MKVVGYTRVSTQEQAEHGISLEAQAAKIQAYTVVKEWPLPEIIRDAGQSAKSLKRPGMTRLLGLVHASEVDVVMVAKLDRLSRRVRDVYDLVELFEKKGVALVSLQENLDATTATGRAMIGLLAVMNQLERELIAERTRDALQHLKSQGKRHCHTVYDNAGVIAVMHRLRAAGQSYDAIARHLNATGVTTVHGGQWQAMTVWGIVWRTKPPKQRRIA
jgi:site-specific DNA recombinase